MRVTNEVAPGPHGPVPVRVYRPSVSDGIGLVWMHGGAFRFGDLDMPEADWVSRHLAGAGVTVVSVDYRLAVDGVHFPVPSDDVIAAWNWATGEPTLAVVPGDWHIGGGSAGGNLAASATLQLRDGAGMLPLSSVLVYPVLHSEVPAATPELVARVTTLPPEARLPAHVTSQINLDYVGDAALLGHPYAFPAHGELWGLPPTLIINSEFDDLRASGQAYGAALVAAGVDTTVICEVGALHGHLNTPDVHQALITMDRIVDWLVSSRLRGLVRNDADSAD